MECLAAGDSIYVTGCRLNQGEMETVIYRIGKEGDPFLAASYPGERMVAWCVSGNGISFLGAYAGSGEENAARQYILRSLLPGEGGRLEETDTWSLTEALQPKELSRFYMKGMIAEDGRLVLLDEKSDNIIVVELSSGEVSLSVPMAEYPVAAAYGGEDEALVLTMDGTLYVYSLLTGSREIRGEKLFEQIRGRDHYSIGQNEVYVGGSSSLYAVNISGRQEKQLLDYDPGMGADGSIWVDETSGAGTAVSWDEESRQVSCYFLSAEPVPDAREGREILTLESYWVEDELRAAAADFNQSNSRYWVEITEGREETDVDASDYSARLDVRLMAKQGPDLLLLSDTFGFSDYIRQGIVEDLSAYIQRDLNPEDYVQAALNAYEKDGGIYALGSGFALSVLFMDDEAAAPLEDFSLQSISRAMDEAGIPMFSAGRARENLLAYCLVNLNGDFSEENVRECILFAEEYEDDSGYRSEECEIGKEVMSGGDSISTPLDIPDIQACYGERITMLGGIMGHENVFSLIFEPAALSINASSENKEGAWEFIKFMLGKEYQFALKDRLPMRKDAFEAMLESYQQPKTFDIYIEDLDEIVTVTDQYHLKRLDRMGIRDGIDAVTPEQTQLLREMVEKGVADDIDREFGAEKIIYEEVPAYYEGTRSLDQVMEIIMNRLNLYLQERK